MKIAVMTGGGDCPGLNAVIQAIVRRSTEYGYEVLGVNEGYKGLLNGNIKHLRIEDVEGIFRVGGTILGSSRTNPFTTEDGPQRVLDNIRKFGVDALIVIGGDDTLGAANKLNQIGIPVVGVPKTIDNDLSATDYCVGFWTAVETASEAIHRLHTTAKSHNRVLIAEVMGRYAGWLTLMAGLIGGAHIILIPEHPFDINSICEIIDKRESEGKKYTIIAVAEGSKPGDVKELITLSEKKDEYGHVLLGGIAKVLEKEISERTGKTTRSVVLGHVQRGGSPNPFDKLLGIRLGILAVDLVRKKKFGYAACLRGVDIVPIKIENMVAKLRTVDESLFELTNFFENF
jgi:6-phosphofructokinase 1